MNQRLTLETVEALADASAINSAQAQRLQARLDDGRSDALRALEALRDGGAAAAAEALADALAEVNAFESLVESLDAGAEALAALQDEGATLRTVIEDAVNALLQVSVGVTFADPGYRPGETAEAALELTNGDVVELRDVVATLSVAGVDWPIDPAMIDLADMLAADDSAEGDVTVAIASDALPASPTATARFSNEFAGETITLDATTPLVVDSPVVMEAVNVSPTEAQSGSVVEVVATLRNDGETPVSGRVELTLPDGWRSSLPSEEVVIAAGESATVTVPAYVSSDAVAASSTVTIGADFTRRGVSLAHGESELTAVLGGLPAVGDARHADLGDAADEAEHALTASESSGTNTEAGLTRRYAGHLTPFSYFEFDMAVDQGEPFLLRAIETYDKPQQKRYKIYIDGEEVFLRTSDHTDGAGTETFEFVVDAQYATDDTVRIRFENQDNAAFYDPSIADVWTLPVPADVNAPQLRASFDPATPDLLTGWYRQLPAGVDLEATDDSGDVTVEYRFGDDEFQPFENSLAIDGEGEHVFDYRARDVAGNETARSATVRIDATAPVAPGGAPLRSFWSARVTTSSSFFRPTSQEMPRSCSRWRSP